MFLLTGFFFLQYRIFGVSYSSFRNQYKFSIFSFIIEEECKFWEVPYGYDKTKK